jgi:hypothetical protein
MNPTTEQSIAQVVNGDRVDVDRAVRVATAASVRSACHGTRSLDHIGAKEML